MGETVLLFAARDGNFEIFKFILSLFPESQRLQAVSVQDREGCTALHHAAISNRMEWIDTILSIYPSESERLQALNVQTNSGETVLHYAARSYNPVCLKPILSLYPESQLLEVVST